ncbi:MAG: DUF4186 family protein [Oscillospiraceae bacterium]|nr:DUF4186 family protein [Oscillospiraceae bacterium]
MPVLMSHYVMLQRNLLYTGVTRAKRALILVGTAKAIACAVHHVTVENRNTMLKARIVQSFAGTQSAAVPACLEEQAHRAWLQRDLFARLGRSRFRSRFHLEDEERRYAEKLGADTLRSHAAELVAKRLAPADPANDGKQTPMRGHPVFVAQHATGTCCRSCLEKWHGIPKSRALTDAEQQYAVDVILRWIARELSGGDTGGSA